MFGLRVSRVVGINLAVLAVGLVLIELIFGNWIFGPDYRDMNIPRDVRKVMDVSAFYDAGGNITYTRDSHGLRGQYDDVGDIDILLLGGSTTNQLVVDDAKTWEVVLAREFTRTGRPVTVVNAAVDGQSTVGHIAVFDRWFPNIPGLRAKYILVYAGINDVAVEGARKYDDMRSPSLDRRIAQYLKNKSALYDLFRTIRGMVRAHDAQLMHGAEKVAVSEWLGGRPLDAPPLPDAALQSKLTAYADRLGVLIERIESFGAKAIFVTQPSAVFRIRDGTVYFPVEGLSDHRQYFEKLDAYNRVTLRVCRAAAATCIDLAHDLAFDDDDYYDYVHYTDRGAEKIGVYLHGKLKHLF